MDLDSKTYSKLLLVNYGNVNFEGYRNIVDAIWPLTKRCDHETPEIWCSRICDPFRKKLDENPRILSKNGYIVICGKLYENDKVHTGHPTDYIYCSVCDSLVFIPRNGYNARIYHDSHLKRCISENTILNEHEKRKEILQSIDRREFQIWQYNQYILREETRINRLRLELFSHSTSHSEKDKLASVSYDYDANLTASYKNYTQSKVPSAPNFEPACISPTRQEMSLPISYHVLNRSTPPPLPQKPVELIGSLEKYSMQHSISAPEIRNLWNDRSNMPAPFFFELQGEKKVDCTYIPKSIIEGAGNLAEAYFDSVRKNVGRK